MARRQTDSGFGRFALTILFLMGAISCLTVYLFIIMVFKPSSTENSSAQEWIEEDLRSKEQECCRGIEHLELWGDAVKWGTGFRFNSSDDCCKACKAKCRDDEPCLCNSWVFCGDRKVCGPRFGEVFLLFSFGSLPYLIMSVKLLDVLGFMLTQIRYSAHTCATLTD